jgi:hypothetical protein
VVHQDPAEHAAWLEAMRSALRGLLAGV